MGMNTILMLIAGIVMSTMVASQVAPSIVEGVKVKKIQVQTINNQEVIFEAIKRYITMGKEIPEDKDIDIIYNLINEDYIDANVNNNGFEGEYKVYVDKVKGVATITTTIKDEKAQEAFLNSFMGTSKPTRVDATNFETKYVIPNEIMHGNALLMTGIPIQDTPPDSKIYKYWYDTNGEKATLKIYDNDSSKWIEINLGGSATPIENEPIEGVPSGAIIMWSGSIATIPSGWALCNGANGTPDLRNKFVIGSSSDVSGVSNTSVTGENTKSGGSKDAIVVSHTHSGTANSGSGGGTFVTGRGNQDGGFGTGVVESGSFKLNYASAGAHTHPLTINSTGSSGTNANLPPYYALAFIMKL